jgi:hypothetical protein
MDFKTGTHAFQAGIPSFENIFCNPYRVPTKYIKRTIKILVSIMCVSVFKRVLISKVKKNGT